MSSESNAAAEALPPHGLLPRYYAGSKRPFVRNLFDQGAADYDRIERIMALGSGSWHRRKALLRAGLKRGMKVLDVAVGTGLVAREEVNIVGDPHRVIGIDPSSGMLAEARRALTISVVLGVGEQLPFNAGAFDFVSMGYALRHVSDLNCAFAEFLRALRPGGIICILELTPPSDRWKLALLRGYMRRVIPLLSRLITRRAQTQRLWEYYWDTIESCVAPQQVMSALAQSGFVDVRRNAPLGIFSEFTARKPYASNVD